jgi:hypothetical protein
MLAGGDERVVAVGQQTHRTFRFLCYGDLWCVDRYERYERYGDLWCVNVLERHGRYGDLWFVDVLERHGRYGDLWFVDGLFRGRRRIYGRSWSSYRERTRDEQIRTMIYIAYRCGGPHLLSRMRPIF